MKRKTKCKENRNVSLFAYFKLKFFMGNKNMIQIHRKKLINTLEFKVPI